METKTCKICGLEKDICFFPVRKYKDKIYYRGECKECTKKYKHDYYLNNKDAITEKHKIYAKNNKDKINEYKKEWERSNVDKVKAARKKYRDNNIETIRRNARIKRKEKYYENRKEEIDKSKRYYQNNKKKINDKRNATAKARKQADSTYRLKCAARGLINKSFRRKGYKKGSKSEKILGCDYNTFINHLLQTYKNNYGIEWDGIEKVHIDHIYPLKMAKNQQEIVKLCHYSNLQLLKAEDNLKKGGKLWKINQLLL